VSRLLSSLFSTAEKITVECHSIQVVRTALNDHRNTAHIEIVVAHVVASLCSILMSLCTEFSDDTFQERHFTDIAVLFDLEGVSSCSKLGIEVLYTPL
jgi:hypothetical protein